MANDQIDNVLADRQTSHGNYADTARTAQHLRQAMREGNNWAILTDIQRESLDMIAMKIARIMSGDPNHADHWDDITGYARLVSKTLHGEKKIKAAHERHPATIITNTPRPLADEAARELARRANITE